MSANQAAERQRCESERGFAGGREDC